MMLDKLLLYVNMQQNFIQINLLVIQKKRRRRGVIIAIFKTNCKIHDKYLNYSDKSAICYFRIYNIKNKYA
jgi:hypothetical protein